jgi:hypothetical protein
VVVDVDAVESVLVFISGGSRGFRRVVVRGAMVDETA